MKQIVLLPLVVLALTFSAMAKEPLVAPLNASSIAAPPKKETVEHAPRIDCESPVFHFGKVENRSKVEHTFELRNTGDLALEIVKVHAACGCTVAKLSSKNILPGESADLKTTLSLRNRKGHVRKSVTITSNDPQTPRLMLYLDGTAIAEVDVSPDRVYFGAIPAETTTVKTVQINMRTNIQISKVESTTANFTATLETIETGKCYKVFVNATPSKTDTNLRGYLKVYTDSKKHGIISIPLSAMVLTPLIIQPPRIQLSKQNKPSVTRYIIIRPGTIKSFEINEVIAPDEEIDVSIRKMGPGYRIQLRNIHVREELNGKEVLIKTTAKEMPEIRVPFLVMPQK